MHTCHVEKGLTCDSQRDLARSRFVPNGASARLSRDLFGPRREKLLCVRLDTEQERVTMPDRVLFACLTAQSENGANVDAQDFQHFMPKGWWSLVSENRQFLFFVLRYINLQTTLRRIKMTDHVSLKTAKAILKIYGMTITKKATGEFRVTYAGMTGKRAEDVAYYSDDLRDAVQTAKAMAEKAMHEFWARPENR
jgi:hypothetical protein